MIIKKQITNIQSSIKELRLLLKQRNIDVDNFLEEMIECLSFICGYVDKSLEKNENKEHSDSEIKLN